MAQFSDDAGLYIGTSDIQQPEDRDEAEDLGAEVRQVKIQARNTFPLLDGPCNVTDTELNQLQGITSNIQQQLYGKINTIGAPAGNLLVSSGDGNLVNANLAATDLLTVANVDNYATRVHSKISTALINMFNGSIIGGGGTPYLDVTFNARAGSTLFVIVDLICANPNLMTDIPALGYAFYPSAGMFIRVNGIISRQINTPKIGAPGMFTFTGKQEIPVGSAQSVTVQIELACSTTNVPNPLQVTSGSLFVLEIME